MYETSEKKVEIFILERLISADMWARRFWRAAVEKCVGAGACLASKPSFFLDFCSTLRQGKVENKL